MRRYLPAVMIVGGVVLMILSYFLLGARWGQAEGPVPYAPLIFVAGIASVFLSAVVYELAPPDEERV